MQHIPTVRAGSDLHMCIMLAHGRSAPKTGSCYLFDLQTTVLTHISTAKTDTYKIRLSVWLSD